jgi:hypothetical protein
MIYEPKTCDTTEETIREPQDEDRQLSDIEKVNEAKLS